MSRACAQRRDQKRFLSLGWESAPEVNFYQSPVQAEKKLTLGTLLSLEVAPRVCFHTIACPCRLVNCRDNAIRHDQHRGGVVVVV
jgi:hypothetical protein